jgi:hypothetical protein
LTIPYPEEITLSLPPLIEREEMERHAADRCVYDIASELG